jgi:hypothetical protein
MGNHRKKWKISTHQSQIFQLLGLKSTVDREWSARALSAAVTGRRVANMPDRMALIQWAHINDH